MNRITPVVKNLLIINILFFLATYVLESQFRFDLTDYLALYYPESPHFRPYQFITHMFMHGGITHIFFNMYALWMFGSPIENAWDGKKFLFYYLFTGLGAAALHTLVNYFIFAGMASDLNAFQNVPSPELFKQFIDAHKDNFRPDSVGQWYQIYNEWTLAPENMSYSQDAYTIMNGAGKALMNIPTVGASGAIFGVLLAFGMMYPNARLVLLIPPIPVKAKWFVLGYGVIELVLGVSQPGSSIAHFAHVGGMLFGYFLIRYWNTQESKRRWGQ